MADSFDNLGELRTNLFQHSADFVARWTGIDRERLGSIESRATPATVAEIEALSRLYGLPVETLTGDPIRVQVEDGVRTLAFLDEFRGVSSETKARIVAAADAARDIVELRDRLGEPAARNKLRETTSRLHPPPRQARVPFQAGAHYAGTVRRMFRMGAAPVASVRDFASTAFPEIAVLYSDLGDPQLAGVTFADARRGPAIVLNMVGKNVNPCVRRFSLAHELCHLLVDWNGGAPLAMLSGFLSDSQLEVEQRANGFAIRFLCPPGVLRRLVETESPEAIVHTLARDYGIHHRAIELYLRKEASMDIPKRAREDLPAVGVEAKWAPAERPPGIDEFPVPAVPSERRTEVAHRAAELYSRGEISRGEFAEFLRVDRTQPLERVLSWFAFDPP